MVRCTRRRPGARLAGTVRGLHAACLFLLLIVPGLVFYIVRDGTPYCSACGRRVPRRYMKARYYAER